MICFKYLWLKVGRLRKKIFSRIAFIFSYFFLSFSALACMIILASNCFDRVPILSYFVREYKLPLTYELCGEVKVLDENGNLVNENVEIYVGGYKTAILTSTEFHLTFIAPMLDEVYVVVRYEVDGEILEFVKCLIIKEENHIIREEFIIYVESL